MKVTPLRILALIGWLLVLLVAGFLGYHYLAPKLQPSLQQEPIRLALRDPDCQPATAPCAAGDDATTIRLALGPGVPVMQPFPVNAEVQLTDEIPTRVTVDFQMIGMDMGRNEYLLEPAADRRWKGIAILPVCATGRTDWQAVMEVETASGQHYQAVFPFQVSPDSN